MSTGVSSIYRSYNPKHGAAKGKKARRKAKKKAREVKALQKLYPKAAEVISKATRVQYECRTAKEVLSRLCQILNIVYEGKVQINHARAILGNYEKTGEIDFAVKPVVIRIVKESPKKRRSIPKRKERPYSEISKEFLESREWRELRYKAIKKYGNKCQCCGKEPPEIKINVDHIKPRYIYPELALDINNLQILCHLCNHGKGAWDETDWR